ncbi:WecB/TagA/CpsF family glycosyltransferase [Stappia stellulata]|uniref:WecB/TagA/CpsF family glycosyltransferase n=1 Tax=Stappia stellulata TaxID=71235 RepID=UPI000413BF3D|nr:WecB/TagA/CpsF family glycosyltransferase [Stappia stellulata]
MNSARPTEPATKTPPQVRIGPVSIARCTQREAIDRLLAHVPDGPALRVAFANAHGLLLAMDDPQFARTLDGFLVLNDGIGAEIGAKLLTGEGFPDNLNGTDFVPALLAAAPGGTRVYLLGAKPEIVARAAEKFAAAHPHILVCGHRDGYFGPDDHGEIVAEINTAAPDILLVAMGNPKQEYLIETLSPSLDVPLALGVGALFDFTAGEVVRAPGTMRRLGLEWVFRFAQEPKRLGGRYTLGVVRYLWKIGGLWASARLSRG